jgi:hypothetical protein
VRLAQSVASHVLPPLRKGVGLMGVNLVPGLDVGDQAVAARVDRRVLVHAPGEVAGVLEQLGRQYQGDWDLIMIAVPAGKAQHVMNTLMGDVNGRAP